jgi:hypothetical protein
VGVWTDSECYTYQREGSIGFGCIPFHFTEIFVLFSLNLYDLGGAKSLN